jgi:hypothetical protein
VAWTHRYPTPQLRRHGVSCGSGQNLSAPDAKASRAARGSPPFLRTGSRRPRAFSGLSHDRDDSGELLGDEIRDFHTCVLTHAGLGAERPTGLGDLLKRVSTDSRTEGLLDEEACHFGALTVAKRSSSFTPVLFCTRVRCPGRPATLQDGEL